MNIPAILRPIIFLFILAVNIGCDQVSKNIVRKNLRYDEEIHLLKNHLTLTKVENTGAFLSLGSALPAPLKKLLLVLLPCLALGFALMIGLRQKQLSRLQVIGISCVAGGGIGNIFDRIRFGSVTDFLHVDFGIVQTGIFNLADVSVMTGAFLLLIDSIRPAKKSLPQTPDASNDQF